MLLKLLKKIFPKNSNEQNKKSKIHETTKKAWIELERYKDVSQALQQEIEKNHFSEILIYDKNKKQKVIQKIKEGEEGR